MISFYMTQWAGNGLWFFSVSVKKIWPPCLKFTESVFTTRVSILSVHLCFSFSTSCLTDNGEGGVPFLLGWEGGNLDAELTSLDLSQAIPRIPDNGEGGVLPRLGWE